MSPARAFHLAESPPVEAIIDRDSRNDPRNDRSERPWAKAFRRARSETSPGRINAARRVASLSSCFSPETSRGCLQSIVRALRQGRSTAGPRAGVIRGRYMVPQRLRPVRKESDTGHPAEGGRDRMRAEPIPFSSEPPCQLRTGSARIRVQGSHERGYDRAPRRPSLRCYLGRRRRPESVNGLLT